MLYKLKSYLVHPLARDLNIDASATVRIRKRIIREKPFLRKIYHEWYQSIIKSLPKDNLGPILELGSGGGFLKDYIPDLITSEILQTDDVDIILDGQYLPFNKATLQGIVMVDVFHHIPCAKSFIADAALCVKPGGFIIMIEPWNTRWSQMIYRYLHHEPFNPTAKNWDFTRGGPLSQANSALPWVVFERDCAMFKREFPQWLIHEKTLHTPFCYLLSGGISLRSFMPGRLFSMCRRIEGLLNPWMHNLAMFVKIVLFRRPNESSIVNLSK
jgi:SAM-dependent methyltransferase